VCAILPQPVVLCLSRAGNQKVLFLGAAAVPSRFFITFDGPQAHVNSVEKHIHYRSVKPQIPPLRFASVGMTKGRATVPWRVADELSVFHHHGWAAGR
jgi:hypothetical protein